MWLRDFGATDVCVCPWLALLQHKNQEATNLHSDLQNNLGSGCYIGVMSDGPDVCDIAAYLFFTFCCSLIHFGIFCIYYLLILQIAHFDAFKIHWFEKSSSKSFPFISFVSAGVYLKQNGTMCGFHAALSAINPVMDNDKCLLTDS